MLQFLQRIFNFVDTRSDLERYIASKHPQHPGDVEHLMKQWAYTKGANWL